MVFLFALKDQEKRPAFQRLEASVRHFHVLARNFALLLAVEVANAPKRDNLTRPSMRANQSERLHRSKEFEVGQNRWRANQIETIIAEFDRICIDLGHQIEAEEMRARICDPAHFAYPTYAKAARERRAKLQRSADALKIELDKLRFEMSEVANPQVAA